MKIKRIISAAAAFALALSLASCGTVETLLEEPVSTPNSSEAEPPDILTPPTPIYDTLLLSDGVKAHEDVTGKELDDAFRSAQYDFAAELFKRSYDDSQNSLVSPVSVMLALSMTANGADGETLSQMENVLGGGMDIAELNRYLYTYSQLLSSNGGKDSAKMSIANSIWYRDIGSLQVSEEFLQNNADYYDASIFKAAFDGDTVYAINNWVSDHTDGMIKKIVDNIDNETMMYLINAIVFDAEWATQYKDTQIRELSFTDINNSKQDATMMLSTEDIYLDDGRAKGFMKPYKGGKYAFAALLPNRSVNIEDYVASLTGEALEAALTPKYGYTVYTQIPKFTFDYDISLGGVLAQMGMPGAFEDSADFSRMAGTDLHISDVLHKTHIEVDDHGTKAAAVTGVITAGNSAEIIENVVEVYLDRPFVFAIVDIETNLPVFIGTVVNI